jgi:hypothetical protein
MDKLSTKAVLTALRMLSGAPIHLCRKRFPVCFFTMSDASAPFYDIHSKIPAFLFVIINPVIDAAAGRRMVRSGMVCGERAMFAPCEV